MRREDFDHVIRAAADVVDLDVIVVIGSQAIHGEVDELPHTLIQSMEVDVFPRDDPERGTLIDGALGDGSVFQDTNGYYAHAVGPETPMAPAGWMDRLVRRDVPARVGTRRPVALCMERHDMVLAKLARGLARDVDYAESALRAGLLDASILLSRVPDLPGGPALRRQVESIVVGLAAMVRPDDRDPAAG